MFPPREPHPQHGQAALAALGAVAIALALGACGRNDPNLETGKAKFVEKCGSCHTLARAGTQGTTGPNLDTAFQAALRDGFDRDTVEGIVHSQILHPRIDSVMPAGLVKGDDASDVAAYVGYAAARKGQDTGALASAGLAQAKTGEQIFTAAGCAGCHTFGPAKSTGTIGPNLNELKTQAGEHGEGQDRRRVHPRVDRGPERLHREGLPERDAAVQGPPDRRRR